MAALADLDRHKFCSTNNLWFDLAAMKKAMDVRGGILGLPLIRNVKTVDPADKTTAEQIVARVPNVSSVVNELTIGPLNTFTERSKDTYVTTKVKTSLVDDKDLFANSIKVTTHRGVVYLMGRVTEREANRASEVARGVSGVTKVVRVFELISEAELAQTQPKTVAPADSAASAAIVRP